MPPHVYGRLVSMKIALALLAMLFAASCNGETPEQARTPSDFALRGIDVSRHQGRIEWMDVADSGISFVYIKATEGTDWIDPRGPSNWQRAKEAGIRVGAYHYYLLCQTGRDQAEHFIDTVPIDVSALPPAIDLEHAQNCGLDQPPEEVRAEISVMISKLRHHYGTDPVIYTTQSFYRDWLQGAFPANPIWIRGIEGYPELPDGRAWAIWQYSHRGRVPGIDGEVDLNVMVEGVLE